MMRFQHSDGVWVWIMPDCGMAMHDPAAQYTHPLPPVGAESLLRCREAHERLLSTHEHECRSLDIDQLGDVLALWTDAVDAFGRCYQSKYFRVIRREMEMRGFGVCHVEPIDGVSKGGKPTECLRVKLPDGAIAIVMPLSKSQPVSQCPLF